MVRIDNNISCVPCAPGCLQCTGPGLQECSRCEETKFLVNGGCYCPGMYYSTNSYGVPCQSLEQSLACHESCAFCMGPTKSQCLMCDPLANKINSDECSCKKGKYPLSIANSVNLSNPANLSDLKSISEGCQPCHKNCEQCYGPNYYECSACPPDSKKGGVSMKPGE